MGGKKWKKKGRKKGEKEKDCQVNLKWISIIAWNQVPKKKVCVIKWRYLTKSNYLVLSSRGRLFILIRRKDNKSLKKNKTRHLSTAINDFFSFSSHLYLCHYLQGIPDLWDTWNKHPKAEIFMALAGFATITWAWRKFQKIRESWLTAGSSWCQGVGE